MSLDLVLAVKLSNILRSGNYEPEQCLAAGVLLQAVEDARRGDHEATGFLYGDGLYPYWSAFLTTGYVDEAELASLLRQLVATKRPTT